ncbi:MAG: YdbL family protein [Dehalococcoidia bacterium]
MVLVGEDHYGSQFLSTTQEDREVERARPPIAMRHVLRALLIVAFALAAAPGAHADALDDLKASGRVGEQIDGYVGIVTSSPSEELRALVDDINRKRRERYAEIARKRGVDISQVAALAGEKLVLRAPPGQYVRDSRGEWRKR